MNARVAELLRLDAERGLDGEEQRELQQLYRATTVRGLLRANGIPDHVEDLSEDEGIVTFGPRSHLWLRPVDGGWEVSRHNGRQWVNMGRTFSPAGVMHLVNHYRSVAPDYPRWDRKLQAVIAKAAEL